MNNSTILWYLSMNRYIIAMVNDDFPPVVNVVNRPLLTHAAAAVVHASQRFQRTRQGFLRIQIATCWDSMVGLMGVKGWFSGNTHIYIYYIYIYTSINIFNCQFRIFGRSRSAIGIVFQEWSSIFMLYSSGGLSKWGTAKSSNWSKWRFPES